MVGMSMAKRTLDGAPLGRPIRLKDIAQEAGLSLSTVSYAMRGSPMVSKVTAKRVQALARKLGYVPSPVLGALAEYRRRTGPKPERSDGFAKVAIVHAYRPGNWPGGLNRQSVWRAIEKRAAELGYQVEVFDAGQTRESQSRLSRMLYSRGIVGVLVAPYLYDLKECVPVALDWRRFVAVSVLNEQPERRLHVVLPSWVRNREVILKQMESGKVRSVGGFVTETHAAWLGGLSPTFVPHRNFIGHPPSDWVPTQVVRDYDKPRFLKWFKKYRPHLVVTNIEWVPVWIRELGLQVPKEHGVIFIDTVQESWRSGIDVLPGHLGITAVNLMHDLLRNLSTGLSDHPYRLTVPGKWQAGETFLGESLPKSKLPRTSSRVSPLA